MSVYVIPGEMSGSDVSHILHTDYHAGTAHLCDGDNYDLTVGMSADVRARLGMLCMQAAEVLCPDCCERVGMRKEEVVTIAKLREL